MKTFNIELHRIVSMSNGLDIRARVDAAVQPASKRDDSDAMPTSTLVMSIENARVLFLLLKAQLAEVDGRKARSQR